MRHSIGIVSLLLCVGIGLLFMTGCGEKPNAVTIYTSVDQDYAEPIIEAFKTQNPEMEVNTVYDSELTKTTGLYTRIRKEKSNPQADVFWNSEIVRTVQLKKLGLLETYRSPSAEDIPDHYKDSDGQWTGFSARARVMVINNNLVPPSETPSSLPSLQNTKYRGKVGMANPEFGTTAAHMTALYILWDQAKFQLIYNQIKKNQLQLLPGNSTVRDQVAAGQLAYGLTDTDDVFAALDENKPVRWAFLNQDSIGTLVIPNTVSLIKNGPNPENGKKFIDYLLSPEVEAKLAKTRARQMPVRPSVERPEGVPDLSKIKVMAVDYEQLAEKMETCLDLFRK